MWDIIGSIKFYYVTFLFLHVIFLHLVSSHKFLNSIKQEQDDIIFPTTYEKHCVWGISDIYWMMWQKFYFWCKKQDFITWKSPGSVTSHFVPVTSHSYFALFWTFWTMYGNFLFLFLITITIPLLSPRNSSFTTFLTLEKIKEILSWWKKVIFSDSIMWH